MGVTIRLFCLNIDEQANAYNGENRSNSMVTSPLGCVVELIIISACVSTAKTTSGRRGFACWCWDLGKVTKPFHFIPNGSEMPMKRSVCLHPIAIGGWRQLIFAVLLEKL